MKDYSKKLETDRLILRKFKESDYKDMFREYASHEIVTKYLTWKHHKTFEDTKKYLKLCVLPEYKKPYSYIWAIELKESKKVIGCIDLRSKDIETMTGELGCVIGEDYWGKGIMTEAAKTVVEYLKQEGFKRLQSYAQVGHIASSKMLQKVGFKIDGLYPKYAKDRDGKDVDVIMHLLELI